MWPPEVAIKCKFCGMDGTLRAYGKRNINVAARKLGWQCTDNDILPSFTCPKCVAARANVPSNRPKVGDYKRYMDVMKVATKTCPCLRKPEYLRPFDYNSGTLLKPLRLYVCDSHISEALQYFRDAGFVTRVPLSETYRRTNFFIW